MVRLSTVNGRKKTWTKSRIRKLRNLMGLTQFDFSKHCGVGVCTIASWENGRRKPSGPSRIVLNGLMEETESVAVVAE